MLYTQWSMWEDEEGRGSGLVPRVPFGDETSSPTWFDLGPGPLDMQMDPRNGQGGYLPAVYGTEFDGTVNPQNLALPGLSVPEVELSGAALWEPNDPTLPQEPFQNAFHEEEQSTGFDPAVVLAVGLPIGHLEEVPISAGASIPGAPVFSVASPPGSHAMDM